MNAPHVIVLSSAGQQNQHKTCLVQLDQATGTLFSQQQQQQQQRHHHLQQQQHSSSYCARQSVSGHDWDLGRTTDIPEPLSHTGFYCLVLDLTTGHGYQANHQVAPDNNNNLVWNCQVGLKILCLCSLPKFLFTFSLCVLASWQKVQVTTLRHFQADFPDPADNSPHLAQQMGRYLRRRPSASRCSCFSSC